MVDGRDGGTSLMTAVRPPVTVSDSDRSPSRLLDLASTHTKPDEPAWLAALRSHAAHQFGSVGIPSARDEEWRFTPVAPLGELDFALASADASVDGAVIARHSIGLHDAPLLVVVDGIVDLAASRLGALPAGVTVASLAAAIDDGDPLVERHLAQHASATATPFAALNAALFTDGALIHVPEHLAVEQPIHVLHVSTGAVQQLIVPRTLAILERGARATLVESFVSAGDSTSFTNACAEIVLAEDAWFEHTRVQREGTRAWHIGLTQVEQQARSHYRSFSLAMGGRLARHDLRARLNAPKIETLLYGMYLARGEQLVDNHTAIHHDHPDCNSWEVYKGVLGERARGVFNGKVLVDSEAQRTDAKQTNRNLLLSDQARIDTKPQLEIFADDVKCTHGATVGRLDEQQRYYLQTRGIGGRAAQSMLMWAFAAEVLLEIESEPVRTALQAEVRRELEAMIA